MRAQRGAAPAIRQGEPVILFAVGEMQFAIAASTVDEIRNTEGLRALTHTELRSSPGKVRFTLDRQGRSYYVVDASFHFHMLPVAAFHVLLLRQPPIGVAVQRIHRMAEMATIHALPQAFTGEEQRWYRGLTIVSGGRGEAEVVPVVNPEAFLTAAEAKLLPSLQSAARTRALARPLGVATGARE